MMHQNNNCGIFDVDHEVERMAYEEVVRPYLDKMGIRNIFVRFDREQDSPIFRDMQMHDIDIICDDGSRNFTISVKAVRDNYFKIFFETIGNISTQSPGWAFYSESDYIYYVMARTKLIIFKLKDVWKLEEKIGDFEEAYGETRDKKGNLLYRTRGRKVPLSMFKNRVIFIEKNESGKYLFHENQGSEFHESEI